MNKTQKIVAVISVIAIAALAAVLVYLWPTMKTEFAGSAQYTEQDSRLYQFYTPELFKNMPRISDHYDFNYASISGPEAQAFAVTFYGTSNISSVNAYLANMGYQPQATCTVEAECWRTAGSKDVVMVAQLPKPERVFIQIYRRP
ncbi:hypothetical protein [Serratia rhizosphaerae]|uniref:Uncharacterized protein n=1 Tax=Serratia rhizosphaerae TaxID=2597702 RepID=A0ABX6GSZ8_9GAMM|nr:hypothetical protein [Serratia rhizosphaerae]MEB6336103.1 hypothetical protein [Serratia rhizosphaerae]QHA89362.1 hypothetical protein FO014_21540 [Serratia rhizosphaerae]